MSMNLMPMAQGFSSFNPMSMYQQNSFMNYNSANIYQQNYCQPQYNYNSLYNNYGSSLNNYGNSYNIYNNFFGSTGFSSPMMMQQPMMMQGMGLPSFPMMMQQPMMQQPMIAPQQSNSLNVLQMLMGLLVPLLMNGTQAHTVDEDEVIVEKKEPELELIADNGGNDTYNVSDSNRNVIFYQDSDANTFNIGGTDNTVSIYDIGKDDRVHLAGKAADWKVIEEGGALTEGPNAGNQRKHLTYENSSTGTVVTVATDNGKVTNSLAAHVSFG